MNTLAPLIAALLVLVVSVAADRSTRRNLARARAAQREAWGSAARAELAGLKIRRLRQGQP